MRSLRLPPCLHFQSIKLCSCSPSRAVTVAEDFIKWAEEEEKKAFQPISPECYCILIRNLTEANRLPQATGLVQALAHDHNATPIPNLCRSFTQICWDLGSKPALFGLLIESLTRVGRIQEEGSHGFGLMIKYGMTPTSLGSWNDLLHALDRLHCTALVWNLFTHIH
jgi:hypothetical protein